MGPASFLVPSAAAGIRALMATASTALSAAGSKLLSASPAVVSKIATKVGTQANPAAILKAIKGNKLLTAYTLYELYGAGDQTLNAMMQADEDVARTIQLFGFTPDEPGGGTTGDLAKMADEFEILSAAVSMMGSFNRLLTLKKALSLSDETWMQYRVVRDMGKVLA